MLASLGALLGAVILVALIWQVEARSVETQVNERQTRAEAIVGTQSVLLAEQIRLQLLTIQQSLKVLKTAFEADPDHFDIHAWRDRMPALSDLADDAFIADAQLVIRHGLNPAEVGLAIGARVPGLFGPQTDRLATDEGLLIASTVQTRQHTLLMLLRLDRPGGWLMGIAYHIDALKRLFSDASLGPDAMTALIDTRLGRVEAVVGPAAANPQYDIAKSAMYAAMQLRPDGTWIGPSALDGVQRIHGFHRIPGHQVAAVVAVAEAEAMRPATAWAQDVRALAVAAMVVVLAALGVALYAIWTFRSKRRLRQSLERELGLVGNAQSELGEARTRLGGRSGQVQALFAAIDEGAVLLDQKLCLTQWNRHVPALLGVAPEALQSGVPLDALLRHQASTGIFGPVDDMEAEVTRRLALLRSGGETVPAIYPGPDGHDLAVFTTLHSDGTLLLLLRIATEPDLHAAAEEASLETSSGAAETF